MLKRSNANKALMHETLQLKIKKRFMHNVQRHTFSVVLRLVQYKSVPWSVAECGLKNSVAIARLFVARIFVYGI